ncbi:PEP-CTERM sorting domain-containing protein [Methylomagnum ishizawai]|uniref:PEP-CTERM sorting domain-containing protein n=1 Tax=Methylomagnum ishizawai TaxID=1760988 RepID=UPI001C32962B|nr:PEP-CTERM sorting domain-containing protein [Methylomagnum ishizawai]BBL76866.1 hypothetical protein MishRS11D_39640 [Methylomagnum ishizawai]
MPQSTKPIPSPRYGDKIALAAGSLALLPAGAEAGVIYSNTPISSPGPSASTPVFWDVDSASGNGDEFGLSFSSGCGCLRSGLVIFSSGLNGSGFVAQTGPGNPFGIANLPLGFKVGNSLASGYAGGFGATYRFITSSGNLGSAPQGFAADVPGYFGFSFTDGIDYFYGWAEMTISLSSQEFTISQWAYNDTPYAAICVGETSGPGGVGCAAAVPEPGTPSLALLGAGAGGLRAWRRRRQAA